MCATTMLVLTLFVFLFYSFRAGSHSAQFSFISLMCMVLCLHIMHGWGLRRPEEGVSSLGIRVNDGCEPPCGCGKSKLDPLQ